MRLATAVVSFYIWLTAASNLLLETGFIAAANRQAPTAASDELAAGVAELQDIQAGSIAAESTIGLFVTVATAAEAFSTALLAAPQIMLSFGIPTVYVVFLHAPLGLIAGRFIIYILAGR